MIKYDNGKFLRILVLLAGSVFPRSLPLGISSFLLGCFLAFARRSGLTEDVFGPEDYIANHYAIMIVGVVVGYLLVMRTNMALDRWMAAMTQIETMVSSWAYAYNTISSFFCQKKTTPEEAERIQFFRVRLAHWFSLMSCMAFSTLRSPGGELIRSIDEVPWVPKYPKGAKTNPVGKGRRPLLLLHAPTEEEVKVLEKVSDKVNTVCLWIIQDTMLELRAKVLDAPPPIVVRPLAAISSGMLGFHQAHKIAVVPFPFPFAQIVSILLVVLYISLPFYLDVFTKNILFTPLMSFVLPMCYSGLNQVSIELESPFLQCANDIEVESINESFIQELEDTLFVPLSPPMTEELSVEKAVARGIARRRSVNMGEDEVIVASRQLTPASG